MPKCQSCGKKGFFLKLTNGLCTKCLETARHQIMATNAVRTSPFSANNTDQARKCSSSQSSTVLKKLTYVEKELLAVQRTTIQDMSSLVGFPYVWNGRLEKNIQPNGHPFAFMDIEGANLIAAKNELQKMNAQISISKNLCKRLPRNLFIPIEEIVFQRLDDRSYSRLICSPVTHTGETSKYPVKLSFVTDMELNDTTHGDLIYSQNGTIEKASIFFWRRGIGYFLYYITHNGEFVLDRVECTGNLNEQMRPSIIYKAPYILEQEAQRIIEEEDFAWIQKNIPEKCPKNVTGYRRMKTQNTKNFQLLKQMAAEKGREI